MTGRGTLSEMKADFGDAFEDDEAEINQLTEEHYLSDPERTKIKPLTTADRIALFDRLMGG